MFRSLASKPGTPTLILNSASVSTSSACGTQNRSCSASHPVVNVESGPLASPLEEFESSFSNLVERSPHFLQNRRRNQLVLFYFFDSNISHNIHLLYCFGSTKL